MPKTIEKTKCVMPLQKLLLMLFKMYSVLEENYFNKMYNQYTSRTDEKKQNFISDLKKKIYSKTFFN